MSTPLSPEYGDKPMIAYLLQTLAYTLAVGILSLSPLLARGVSATSEQEIRAVIYGRVSTDLQSETSIDQQVRECRSYCAMQGWEVVKVYRDDGFSGTNVERPAYQQMMDEMDTWDVVVGAKMDRLHRNVRNAGEWADTLRKAGRDFAFLDIQIDTTTPVGMLIFRIMTAFAAMEADLIKARTKAGLKGKKNAGKHTGRPPYGYASKFARTEEKEDKGVLEPEPTEVPVLRNIFSLNESGLTYAEIAESLNERGIPTRQEGKIWTGSTIRGILAKDDFYHGIYLTEDGERLSYEWEGLL